MTPDAAARPRVWLLVGDRKGDNQQAEAVANALPFAVTRKYVHVREPFATEKPRVEPSVHHLDLAKSDALEAPWPDLVVTMGRRLSMVALWIRAQAVAARSTHRVRIVLVGKPSGLDDEFDLVVISAETPLPPRPNLAPIGLPLLRVDPALVASEAEAWRPTLEALARPRIALLLGGPTRPFRFDLDVLDEVVDGVLRCADEARGSLAVATSPRTPEPFHARLRERLEGRAWLHCFERGGARNPYLGLLGTADRFVVTGDSVSMLVEIARLGKPLAIHPLPRARPKLSTRVSRGVARAILPSTGDPAATRVLSPLGYALYRAGWVRHSRDFDAIYASLVDGGLATWFGQGFSRGGVPAPDELGRVAARIERMLEAA